jgi:Na+-transporting methylmalonyl-CoA/oxaloacetate decarboxylase gamma subunit
LNEILQGLQISVLGLAITFTAILLVIFVIVLLTRVFPAKPEAEKEAIVEPAVIHNAENREDEEVAIAVAIALSRLQAGVRCRNGLGTELATGHGAWWKAGRILLRGRVK